MTTYTYQTIDPPGSTYTIAESINSNGQIVGFYQDSNNVEHGFLDNNGIYTTIEPPGSVEAVASDINSGGQIVGVYYIAGGGALGFLDSKGTYTTIDPPGTNNRINGNLYINKTGQIVGTYRDSSGVDHGFLYSHGAYTTLNFPHAIDPEAIDTYALSINDAGQVVGAYLDNNGLGGALHGFLYSHGTYTAIEPPGAFDSSIRAINKFGTMVGWYQESSSGPQQGFMYSHGTYTTIDFPGAIGTVPVSINDKGQVTGYYAIGSSKGITADYSFVYSNGQYTTINPPGSTSPIAYSINNSGQVVGEYADNTNHGFVATDPPQATQTTASSSLTAPAQATTGVQMTGDVRPHTPPGLDHVVALFNQYLAAGLPVEQGAPITNALSQIVTNQEQFLAQPHHG